MSAPSIPLSSAPMISTLALEIFESPTPPASPTQMNYPARPADASFTRVSGDVHLELVVPTALERQEAVRLFEQSHNRLSALTTAVVDIQTESRQARLSRLQREVAELVAEMDASDAGSDTRPDPGATGDLVAQARALSRQIQQLGAAQGSAGRGHFAGATQAQAEALRAGSGASAELSTIASAAFPVCEDPLQLKELLSRSVEQQRAIESRIHALEQALKQAGFLTPKAQAANHAKRLGQLEQSLNALDTDRLSGLVTRARETILPELEAAAGITSPDSLDDEAAFSLRLARCYEAVTKWDQVAETLPIVVQRMQQLAGLHHQAAGISNTVDDLRSEQQQLLVKLHTQASLLKKLDAAISEAAGTIAATGAAIASSAGAKAT
ncbi:hypothetical protein H696_01654 [Fonticula alba]|uniref:Uncharacterized protein n=1 Tax=Fonticula alba TaxID=691883 RepID=A0A058ZCW5_FONAL|nr:hypothetical protein H696_01654 [Fonticula alba]KCV72255.1 hypothetical protein H696_01654 [Fonticula alba]|eukprot:XP_009493833.1 hypothetical protein H696_01654 [Fonticula alba]